MNVHTHILDTPLGSVSVRTNDDGAIHGLCFRQRLWQPGRPSGDLAPGPAALQASLAAYFAGDLLALGRLQVAPRSHPLHERVRLALLQVAPGCTLSYGELARAAGLDDPQGAVQIGAVLAANPIALLVPCHRIIAKNGDLKGYAWGTSRKAWLLEHEGARRNLRLAL